MPEPLLALWRAWVALAPELVGPVYPLLSAAHILALALLLGTILALDLRLLGLSRAQPLQAWSAWLARLSAAGFAGALATGFLLFSVQPAHYAANQAFRLKLLLIALAAANGVWARRSSGWRAIERGAEPTSALRIAAAASLLLWVGVLVAGRYIAFV